MFPSEAPRRDGRAKLRAKLLVDVHVIPVNRPMCLPLFVERVRLPCKPLHEHEHVGRGELGALGEPAG
ncbi:MAG: hypothetical protein ACYTG0_08730 [Planctomycetota bacterium]|jgi:hypothetical protein